MRILHLISSSGFYGAENVVLQLAEHQMRLDCKVIVVIFFNTHDPQIKFAKECIKRNIDVKIIKCKGKIDVSTILALKKILKKNNIEIVHSHGYKSNIYSFLASIKMKLSLVSTCHNWIYLNKKMYFYAKLDRFILRFFDKVIAVSAKVNELIIDSKIPIRKIRKIETG